MIVNNNEYKTLIEKEINICLKENEGLISTDEYIDAINEIKKEKELLLKQLIEDISVVKEPKVEKELISMKTETTKEKKPSNTNLIIKALSMKTIKNIDAAFSKVKSEKPEVEEKGIKAQIKTVIKRVKAGEPRWAKYTWNEAEYLLEEKQ